jgi:hypothetical protein
MNSEKNILFDSNHSFSWTMNKKVKIRVMHTNECTLLISDWKDFTVRIPSQSVNSLILSPVKNYIYETWVYKVQKKCFKL